VRQTPTQSPNPFHSEFTIKGNLTIQDIGSSLSATWICAVNGTILKSSSSAVTLILTNTIKGDCLTIDVDNKGFPWVVTKVGDVYRLKQIYGSSAVWVLVNDGKKEKALDIGCGHDNNTSCYIAVENSKYPYYFNGETFEKMLAYSANSLIRRIDVGSGVNGDLIAVVNEDYFVLELKKNSPPVSLGMIATDVSIGYNNQIYACNSFGVFVKSRCSNYFTRINDLFARDISAGSEIWLIGVDSYIYNGKVYSYVTDCD